MFAAFEAAFERFEADVDGSELPMASLPWPPEDVPVSGVRRSDSANPNPYNPRPNPSPSPNPRPDANPNPNPNPDPNPDPNPNPTQGAKPENLGDTPEKTKALQDAPANL